MLSSYNPKLPHGWQAYAWGKPRGFASKFSSRLREIFIKRGIAMFCALLLVLPAGRAEQWLDLFGGIGIGGQIYDATRVGNHVVVSGYLFAVGDERTYNLASFDLVNRRWTRVPIDIGAGSWSYHAAGLEIDGELVMVVESAGKLFRYHDGEAEEFSDLGARSIQQLLTIDLIVGQRVVAVGSFNAFPNSEVAVWDGSSWTSLDSLRYAGAFVLERDGRQQLALVSGNQLALWDGKTEQTIVLPGINRIGALAALNGDLIICDSVYNNRPDFLYRWDGFSLTPLPLELPGTGSCHGMTSRTTPEGDQLVSRSRVSDGESDWVPWDLPATCAAGKVLSTAGSILTIDDGVRDPGSLCIWDGASWIDAVRSIESTKPTLAQSTRYRTNDGLFFWDSQGQGSSQGWVWTDSGFAPKDTPGYASRFSWPSPDLTRFYSIVDQSLQVESAEGSQRIPLDEYGTYLSIAGVTPSGVFVLAHELGLTGQFLKFDGALATLGAQTPLYSYWPQTLYLPETSSTPGLYTFSADFSQSKSCGTRRVRVRRFFEGKWSDITPAEFLDASFSCDVPVLSVLVYEGEQRIFAAYGDYFGYYGESGWLLFPKDEGAGFRGPVALSETPDGTCFFVAAISSIHRYCDGKWSRPRELTLYSQYLGFNRIGSMEPATYQGRPVLLVQGGFLAAGRTAQLNFAVLDLTRLHANGFEF